MNFDGDQSTIPPEIKILLEDMINYVPPSEKTNSRYPFALGFMILGVASIIAIPWGVYQYQRSINQRIAQQSTTALDQTPELSVYRLETQVVDRKIKLLGKVPSAELQKKAADVVSQVLPTWSIDNQIIAVDVPVDPSFTAAEIQRATIVMNKIPGVFISSQYKEGVLEINGMVKARESIGSITQIMRTIPGVKILSNQIQLGNINQNNISNRIYFEAGSATLPPNTLPQISEFRKLLNLNPNFRLRITGSTDATGDPFDNQRLALARANSVQQILLEQGLEQRQLEIKGFTDTTSGAAELWQSRFVEFELIAPNNQN
jgi:outer membrane protein OmpA-like peptidoglycan-associated protein